MPLGRYAALQGRRRTACLLLAITPLSGCGSDGASAPAAVAPDTIALAPAPTPTPAPTSTGSAGTAEAATAAGLVVQAGDSIGAGELADAFAAIDHMGLGAAVKVVNVSVSGRLLSTGYANRNVELFPLLDPARASVLMIQQGTNDLGTGAGAADLYRGVLTPFVATAQAAGFYVVITTLLPRADRNWSKAKEAERLAYNRMVRSNGAGADAINDWSSDPVMGDAVNPATSPYFSDALHPNGAGQARLAILDAAALRPFLLLGARVR